MKQLLDLQVKVYLDDDQRYVITIEPDLVLGKRVLTDLAACMTVAQAVQQALDEANAK